MSIKEFIKEETKKAIKVEYETKELESIKKYINIIKKELKKTKIIKIKVAVEIEYGENLEF